MTGYFSDGLRDTRGSEDKDGQGWGGEGAEKITVNKYVYVRMGYWHN